MQPVSLMTLVFVLANSQQNLMLMKVQVQKLFKKTCKRSDLQHKGWKACSMTTYAPFFDVFRCVVCKTNMSDGIDFVVTPLWGSSIMQVVHDAMAGKQPNMPKLIAVSKWQLNQICHLINSKLFKLLKLNLIWQPT